MVKTQIGCRLSSSSFPGGGKRALEKSKVKSWLKWWCNGGVEANIKFGYQSLCPLHWCYCSASTCVLTEDNEHHQNWKTCSDLIQTVSPGWRACDAGTLYKGKYSAISDCKSLGSDKNPCFTVKKNNNKKTQKTVLFKYEYRTEFLFFGNQKSVKSVAVPWNCPPHYNSMSWASSSEKSDMELSEEESPPPSSCSFRASSVAYRWMYSEMRNTGIQFTWWHCLTCLSRLFLQSTHFTESVKGFKCLKALNAVKI